MKFNEIQQSVKTPKDSVNEFGKYRYRTCSQIIEAVKPLLGDATLTISDEIVMIGDRHYVKATAVFEDKKAGDRYESTAYAREPATKKGMDESQITGAASTYARKTALGGLFALDDSRDDPDARAPKPDAPDGTDGRLADAKRSLAEACRCYAERYGLDPDEVMRGVSDRADYAEGRNDPAWFLAVADEFMSS